MQAGYLNRKLSSGKSIDQFIKLYKACKGFVTRYMYKEFDPQIILLWIFSFWHQTFDVWIIKIFKKTLKYAHEWNTGLWKYRYWLSKYLLEIFPAYVKTDMFNINYHQWFVLQTQLCISHVNNATIVCLEADREIDTMQTKTLNN